MAARAADSQVIQEAKEGSSAERPAEPTLKARGSRMGKILERGQGEARKVRVASLERRTSRAAGRRDWGLGGDPDARRARGRPLRGDLAEALEVLRGEAQQGLDLLDRVAEVSAPLGLRGYTQKRIDQGGRRRGGGVPGNAPVQLLRDSCEGRHMGAGRLRREGGQVEAAHASGEADARRVRGVRLRGRVRPPDAEEVVRRRLYDSISAQQGRAGQSRGQAAHEVLMAANPANLQEAEGGVGTARVGHVGDESRHKLMAGNRGASRGTHASAVPRGTPRTVRASHSAAR